MKLKKTLALLLASVMTMGLAASTVAASEDEIVVSVILKTLSSEYWQYVKAGCDAYAEEHEGVRVKVAGPPSETSFDEMTNMIQTELVNDENDVLVIAPLQSESVAAQIVDAKVPVLALDTKIDSPDIVTFVGTGNEEAAKEGAIAAVAMAKDLGWEEIKCIEIAGVQGDQTNTARMDGYRAGVNESGGEFLDDEVQYAEATADRAVTAMEGIMSKFPEGIAIICANNDDMALAAAQTAKGNEAYKNTVFLGFNGDAAACEAMAAGTYENYISVAQQAYDMGYKGVEAAVQAVNGEELPEFVDSGAAIITKENAQERLDTLAGYLK